MSYDERCNFEEVQIQQNIELSSYKSITGKTLNEVVSKFEYDPDDLLKIDGPYSGLETQLNSIAKVFKRTKYVPDRNSINYALLDDDPSVKANRLLVGHEVRSNEDRNKCTISYTCLLPKRPGLNHICCLLFTPLMEPRCV